LECSRGSTGRTIHQLCFVSGHDFNFSRAVNRLTIPALAPAGVLLSAQKEFRGMEKTYLSG
jgi:hypothetical protein